MGTGYPLPNQLGGLGERRKFPQHGLGAERRRKTFLRFLSVPERLLLQRLLKTNVVHSDRCLGKMGLLLAFGVAR